MTSKLTRERTQQIIDAADAVISALAGTNDEVHKDDTDKMIHLWDDLNDRYAPPEVVRELARMALASMDRDKVRNEHAKWSQATFGVVGPVGPLKHLSKEALKPLNSPATCQNGLICSSCCGTLSAGLASLMIRLPRR